MSQTASQQSSILLTDHDEENRSRHDQVSCNIVIIHQNAFGGMIKKIKSKGKGRVTLGRDERGKIAIFMDLGKGQEQRSYSTRGGVALHGRFIHEGKATISLVQQRVQILMSKADARHCSDFMRLFLTKLEALKKRRQEFPSPPQPPSVRNRPLSAPPLSITSISPPSENERTRCPLVSKRKADAEDELSPTKRAKLERTLSEEQNAILDTVLRGQSIFFTGSAGTGKSYLLKKVLAGLPTKGTYVTASTGVAACHIGGTTLHGFAGFKPGSGQLPRKKEQWRNAKRLVIDEISMVDGDWFDELEEVARKVRGNSKPFGGIQLIVCGDFLQLPPVSKTGETKKFCFEARTWKKCMKHCVELQEVHRQSDPTFIDLLRRVRFGVTAAEDLQTLKETGSNVVDYDGIEATQLCTHVKDAAEINTNKLRMLPGVTKTFAARDDVGGDYYATKILDASCRAPGKLELKVGAQVMLVKNINVQKGLANGSRGVIAGFSGQGLPIVKFVSGLRETMRRESWTVGIGQGRVATRQQIPIQLAWGISIHKSQGMTLDAVQVDLGKVFECGQAYVALSRARTLEGLRVKNFSARSVRANASVLRFYKQLSDASE